MSTYSEARSGREQDCVIVKQLINLAKKGYKLPWIRENGIAPIPELILEELTKKPSVPGSISCLTELKDEYGIDAGKLQIAADQVLEKGELLSACNFWKVTMKALENEIEQCVDTDLEWAELLFARYATYALRSRNCHAETTNDLLTVIYEAEEAFAGHPELKIKHLLGVVKAWKSGLLCGVVEEAYQMQERFVGRAMPVYTDFSGTIEKISSLYFDVKGAISDVKVMHECCQDEELKNTTSRLLQACDGLLCTIRNTTPIFDKDMEQDETGPTQAKAA